MINTHIDEHKMFMELAEAYAGMNQIIVDLENIGVHPDDGIFHGQLFHSASKIGGIMYDLLTHNRFTDPDEENDLADRIFSEEILPDNYIEKGNELWKKYRE